MCTQKLKALISVALVTGNLVAVAAPENAELDTYVPIPNAQVVRAGKVAASTPTMTNTVPVVEAIAQNVGIAKTIITTVSNNTSMVSAKDGSDPNNTFIDRTGVARKDYRVLIGHNARSDGNDSDHGQSITIGRDAESHGPATVVVGPNAEADNDGFNVVAGWRAIATKKGGIAIGTGTQSGQNYWLDEERTQHNPNEKYTAATGENAISIGRATRAEATDAISIGANAKTTAQGAVQLGQGINTEANTLKFRDVTLVKDGKINGFDDSELDPVEHVVSTTQSSDIEIDAKPHVINTITAESSLGPGTELGLNPMGSRNYEVYLPNTEEVRAGMTISTMVEIPGVTCLYRGFSGDIQRLPAIVTIRQPNAKTVIIKADIMDDGYDWTPVVTNCNVFYKPTDGTFFATNAIPATQREFSGYNLHGLQSIKVAYVEDSTGSTVTNSFFTLQPKDRYATNAYYGYTSIMGVVGETPTLPTGSRIRGTAVTGGIQYEYDFIYTTVNGETTYHMTYLDPTLN